MTQLTRRDFLKTVGTGAGALVVLGSVQPSGRAANAIVVPSTQQKAILYDATKCVGCLQCQVACRAWNKIPPVEMTPEMYANPPALATNTWVTLNISQGTDAEGKPTRRLSRRSCNHCTDAPCVEVCPAHAVYRNEFGIVSYNKSQCIGCGYCSQYCPFQAPRLQASRATGMGKMDKCTMCTTPGLDRLSQGLQPACVEACPVKALIFGNRDDLVVEGKQRVATLRDAHPQATLYGETEMGGLHIMQVLTEPTPAYGLVTSPQFPLVASIQNQAFRPYTGYFWAAAAAGLALNVLVSRARGKPH